jgi:hypothetical protein
MRVTLLSLIGVGAAVAASAPVEALDGDDLQRLTATVHDMCVQPDKKGSYLKIDGDLSAGATLTVVGVKGEGKVTKEDWDGINQRLDQYKTDPRQCAISLLPILINAMGGRK